MKKESRDPPERDRRATEPTHDEPSRKPSDDEEGKARGGPYGNPEVDEEALRRRQEERARDDPD